MTTPETNAPLTLQPGRTYRTRDELGLPPAPITKLETALIVLTAIAAIAALIGAAAGWNFGPLP